MKKILIMGLPGAGKTTLANKLAVLMKAKLLNADITRKKFNDWDFSDEGRLRQAKRMHDLALELINQGYIVIADFICPTPQTRRIFNPDFIIWVDTIDKGRFDDTNRMFESPDKYNVRVTEQDAEKWSKKIFNLLKS